MPEEKDLNLNYIEINPKLYVCGIAQQIKSTMNMYKGFIEKYNVEIISLSTGEDDSLAFFYLVLDKTK